ncbi:MAG: cytochrome c [Candidatus Eremiobacteraeota bacterium]|nr:cytochrome c [Candidatus Eremiobacteraeota bacterium]
MILHHVRGAVIGIAAVLGIALGAGLTIVYTGYAPMAADSAPSSIEANLAMKALHAASERQMGDVKSPIPANEANLSAGLITYRQNCIMCHGAADGKGSNIASGFYVPSPQFAKDGAEDDPEGATYWKIRHGIRFSAMPAFQHSLKDTQIWQVALFLKHMDALPKPVDAAWKSTKSVGGTNMAATPKMNMK